MKGDYSFKFTFCCLLCSILLLGNVYFVFAQNDINLTGPPGAEEAQTIWQNIKQGVKGFFQTIKGLGEGIDWFTPFFENTGKKISDWWSLQASPWVNNNWKDLNHYLNQKIIID